MTLKRTLATGSAKVRFGWKADMSEGRLRLRRSHPDAVMCQLRLPFLRLIVQELVHFNEESAAIQTAALFEETMKTIALCLASATLALAALPAHAAYVIDVRQVGANVVATGSGTIDWTDLSFVGFYDPGSPAVNASAGFLVVGAPSYGDYYSGATGPADFGSGGLFAATSGTGTYGFEAGVNGSGEIVVPSGYFSGAPISTNTAIWDGETLASLGLTSGDYVWTWGTGANADSLTIDIAVPEPITWAMLILGLGATGAVLRRRREGTLAAA